MELKIDSVQHGKDIGFAISVLKAFCTNVGVSTEQVAEAIYRLENLPLFQQTKEHQDDKQ